MSPSKTKSATKPKPMTATQRKTLAMKLLVTSVESDTIQAPSESTLTIASLEIISEWIGIDPEVQQRLRDKYEEIAALSAKKPKSTPQIPPMPTVLPGRGRSVDTYNPYAKLDPYELLDDYGAHQLRAALMHMTSQSLKDAVAIVQERNPGTAPKTKTKSADMIDYIVEHVAGPGY